MIDRRWPFRQGRVYVDPETHTPFDRIKLGCDPEFDGTCHAHVCMACAAAHGLPGAQQDVHTGRPRVCSVSGCHQKADIVYYFNAASVVDECYYQIMMNA